MLPGEQDVFVAACASPLNESPAVIGAQIESETRRGGDCVRVTITAAVAAGADRLWNGQWR